MLRLRKPEDINVMRKHSLTRTLEAEEVVLSRDLARILKEELRVACRFEAERAATAIVGAQLFGGSFRRHKKHGLSKLSGNAMRGSGSRVKGICSSLGCNANLEEQAWKVSDHSLETLSLPASSAFTGGVFKDGVWSRRMTLGAGLGACCLLFGLGHEGLAGATRGALELLRRCHLTLGCGASEVNLLLWVTLLQRMSCLA